MNTGSTTTMTRTLLERAYIKGQHDALAGRRMACPWSKSRVLRALYEAGYEASALHYSLREAA